MTAPAEVERPVWTPFIGVIYGFRLIESHEIRYVGLTRTSIRRRTHQHFKNASAGVKNPFYDWLRKQDEAEVFVEPLEVVTTSREDLGAAEQNWIARLKFEGHALLNLAEGGLGPVGIVWTTEMREAASLRGKGRKGLSRPGPENPMWGRSHSDEQKASWSVMRAGTISGDKNPNYGKFGEAHPSYGRVLSEGTRQRLSEQRRGSLNPNFGKTASEETRAKMSEVRKGRPMPSSVRSAHIRYHTNKGVFKDTCKHCIDDRKNERDSE